MFVKKKIGLLKKNMNLGPEERSRKNQSLLGLGDVKWKDLETLEVWG